MSLLSIIVCLFTSLLVIGVFICVYRKSKKRIEQYKTEVQLLSERIESLSIESSKRVQIFAHLSQILASSFNREVLFNQIVRELSQYFPSYEFRLIIKNADNTAYSVNPTDSYTPRSNLLDFNMVMKSAMAIETSSGTCSAQADNYRYFLDENCITDFMHLFPLLTEEKIQGYLFLSKKTAILPDEQLFFMDITTLLSSAMQSVLTTHERDYINEQFGYSVDDKVRDYLLANGGYGKIQSVSVLFFDIRNFTSLSEKLGPGKSVSLLNDIFSRCDGIIRAAGGFINKFTGDGFMAVFGAPIQSDDHAKKAVDAALEILNGIDIAVGIGIASGEAVAGTIGSEKRKEYTVIGDTVNTASRVEGLCKVFGSALVVSGATLESSGYSEEYRYLGILRLKGKDSPVKVYDMFSQNGCYESQFDDAVATYYNGDFSTAITLFDSLSKDWPHDEAIRWYHDRAQKRLQRNEPWDGIEQMAEK